MHRRTARKATSSAIGSAGPMGPCAGSTIAGSRSAMRQARCIGSPASPRTSPRVSSSRPSRARARTGCATRWSSARPAHIVTAHGEFLSCGPTRCGDDRSSTRGHAAQHPRVTRSVQPRRSRRIQGRALSAARTGAPVRFEYRIAGPAGTGASVRQATEPIQLPGRRGQGRSWFNILADGTDHGSRGGGRESAAAPRKRWLRLKRRDLRGGGRAPPSSRPPTRVEAYDYSISHRPAGAAQSHARLQPGLARGPGRRLDAAGRTTCGASSPTAEQWRMVSADAAARPMARTSSARGRRPERARHRGAATTWRSRSRGPRAMAGFPGLVAQSRRGAVRATLGTCRQAWKFTEKVRTL